jgi:hypothetical protein
MIKKDTKNLQIVKLKSITDYLSLETTRSLSNAKIV